MQLVSRLFSLTLAILMVSCSGADGPADDPGARPGATTGGSPQGLDACTVITADDIRQVLGWEPGPAVVEEFGVGTRCVWPAADGSDPLKMTVIHFASSPLASGERSVESARKAGIEFERIEGVGDLTTWLFGDLQMWANGQKVQIARPGSSDREGGVALAERALARLR